MGRDAKSICKEMTLEEKCNFIAGHEGFYINEVKPANLRKIRMADGPMGVRECGESTAYPANILMASTWNRDLIYKAGHEIGEECRSLGVDVLLAPGVNLYRVPHNGRNFEYMGEDPFLASEMCVEYIKGVQENGIIATIKHLACNNQDYDRHRISSNVGERTLRELYLKPFEAAVKKGGVKALMTAYNPVNGIHASENSFLIDKILRDEWGFEGIVMSDWDSVYSTDCIKTSLDIEMPSGLFMNYENIKSLIDRGEISENIIDEKIVRILDTCIKSGLYGRDEVKNEIDFETHRKTALELSREGIILLKNSGTLPLNRQDVKKIAVTGPYAVKTPASGGGAAMVKEYADRGLFEEIKSCAGSNIVVEIIECSNNTDFGSYDAVIYCAGFLEGVEGEGHDRPFNLDRNQDDEILKISKKNENTVVLITAGGGIAMNNWAGSVSSILHLWYGGENGTRAATEIIFGDINPSGKLPISIEREWKDAPCFNSYDPSYADKKLPPLYSLNGKPHEIVDLEYSERLFTGYRHFDKKNIEPLFCFGHGLSYTKFEYLDFSLSSEKITGNEKIKAFVKVKNIGARSGLETVQIYGGMKEPFGDDPVKKLISFDKIFFESGEVKTITYEIDREMFSIWCENSSDWIVRNGEYIIYAGASSRDIKGKIVFNIE